MKKMIGIIKDINTKNLVSLDKSTQIKIQIENPQAFMEEINRLAADPADTCYQIKFMKQGGVNEG
jgi:hypothetical protein